MTDETRGGIAAMVRKGLLGSIALAIGVAVYISQIVASTWWLRRYRYGPLEWLWRTLMYGTRQPMIVARASRQAPSPNG